jgi:hypothetical protein
VARDATARQYDVDADAVTLDVETGEITFRAKKGRLVDLDKLHESIRATRLGVGTGMAMNWIDVTAVGEVVVEKERLVLKVKGSDQSFVLKEGDKKAFAKLRDAVKDGQKDVSVFGRVDGWKGHFPPFLKVVPKRPREILVKKFEAVKADKPAKKEGGPKR